MGQTQTSKPAYLEMLRNDLKRAPLSPFHRRFLTLFVPWGRVCDMKGKPVPVDEHTALQIPMHMLARSTSFFLVVAYKVF